jgi:hypothetical protein
MLDADGQRQFSQLRKLLFSHLDNAYRQPLTLLRED